MKTPPRNYNCGEELLYRSAENGWDLAKLHLPPLTAFDPDYTDTFIADKVRMIRDAEAIMSIDERNSQGKRIRIRLMVSARLNRGNFLKLVRYIVKLFPADELDTYLSEVGHLLYPEAAKNNWDAMRNMLKAEKKFMNKYSSELAVKMPDTLQAQYARDVDNFMTLLTAFERIERQISDEAKAKVKANNAVYEALLNMCLDAQKALEGPDNKDLRKQFTFADIKRRLKGSVPAGIKGYLSTKEGEPIADVEVSTTNGRYKTKTDANGFFHIARMEHGEWPFTFRKPGLVELDETFKIKTSTTRHVDLIMEAEEMKNAA